MKNKKIYSFAIVIFIAISLGLSSFENFNVKATNPYEPIFEDFTAEGFENFNGINFPNNTLITVEYSVNRYVGVGGIQLVGLGSNLSFIPENSLKLNFSYSLRDRTYYEGSFNLTSMTQFKGYSWVGDISNGTYEEVEIYNHLEDWHYLYVTEEGVAPEFDRIHNASATQNQYVYYSPSNKTDYNIVIRYKVYNGNENDTVTLAVSKYRDKISNYSLNVFDGDVTFIKMDYVNETHSNYVVFNTTILLTERTIYFCANNSYGWDTWTSTNELGERMNIYLINNGFYFYSEPTLKRDHTEVDNVEFNITSHNATEVEKFGLNYYVEQSTNNDTEIVPFSEIEGTLNRAYTIENQYENNDTIREYIISIGTFDVGNVIYYQAYNKYYGETYNESAPGSWKSLVIYDSKPTLTLYPRNNTYTNVVSVNFSYVIQAVGGEIYNVSMDFDDGSPLLDLTAVTDNYTIHNYPQATGSFFATLYVTINLTRINDVPILVSNTTYTIIYLDFEKPTLNIIHHTNNLTEIVDGYVEIFFEYSDAYAGIKRVWIFWDDGVVQNVTGRNYVFHNYVNSSTYIVTIMVEDLAGNQFNSTITFTIVLPTSTIPTNQASITAITSVLSIFALGYLTNKKHKK